MVAADPIRLGFGRRRSCRLAVTPACPVPPHVRPRAALALAVVNPTLVGLASTRSGVAVRRRRPDLPKEDGAQRVSLGQRRPKTATGGGGGLAGGLPPAEQGQRQGRTGTGPFFFF
jgi:hypothetical protein